MIQKKYLLFILLMIISKEINADIIIFKNCKSKEFTYKKNDYKLDLTNGIVTREYIYDEKSYKKLRLNDMTIQKNNTSKKGILEENNLIVSEISGYPAFYTQMIFDIKEAAIKIKTVLNNTEGISLMSKCDNVINYKKET